MGDLKIQVQRLIDAGVPEQEIGAFIQKHSSETTASSQKSGGATGTWDEDQTWGNVLKESASNIPESAVNYGKNMIEPFRRPVETARGLGRLVSGLAGKLMPDEITLPNGEVIKTDTKNEFIVDALWKGIKNRYGSEENIKRTISNKPFG